MAKINGQIVICDRCGAQVFRRCTGDGETDGGFTRWNNFEELPAGWDKVAIPTVENALIGNAYNSYIEVCPTCHALWAEVVNENYLKGTPYYKETEAKE